MKLLIIGSKGQLGTELVRQAVAGHELAAVDREQLDITDAQAVSAYVRSIAPDVVVNAAAYTAVDRAESEREAAFAVNRDGAANLAKASEAAGIPLIHISTDYVFDGRKKEAYIETDPAAPLGVYGASKWAGEEAVRKYCARHLILRTSWVFSAHGHNFVKTMLKLGGEREQLRVVADQFGKPTSADELARVILALLPKMAGRWGTYHLAQPERTSWHGFAVEIFSEAARQGWPLKVRRVDPIPTEAYPTPAKRPANSELDCKKLEEAFDIQIKPWRESLGKVIRELKHG